MAPMTKIERVQAALQGEPVDRPPYAFWFHYPADKVAGRPAAEAHLATYRTYDQDILKVMNDNGYDVPDGTGEITTAAGLAGLPPTPVESPCFENQLEALRLIREALAGECYVLTTIFHPLNVAEKLIGGSMADLLREDRQAALAGLGHIAVSLATFARACLEAGADGIFMSCQDGIDRDLGRGFYHEHIAPTDVAVFQAAEAATMNVLHVHGDAQDFDAFLDYPVHAVNWASRASGPAIRDVAGRMRPAPMAGMNHETTVPSGDAAAVAAEIRDAVAQAGDRPLIVAPGCSFPSDATDAVMRAVGDTCRAMAD